jgi:predicted SAM-dependent methyltransferase
MHPIIKSLIRSAIPSIRRLHDQRNDLAARLAATESKLPEAESEKDFLATLPNVLQYRRVYFEIHGNVAPNGALPSARAWPNQNNALSYREKLIGHLRLESGRGAEIGPLNLPLLSKNDCDVLFVDHLDTAGLQEKYSSLTNIAEIDRPMVDDSLEETLRADGPLDYVVASQVMEHVPNPIRWMNEIAAVLNVGGLLSISLPDRRMTFDLYREETSASDMIAAYLQDITAPDARAVYDHQSLASAVNMHWAIPDSVYPPEVTEGKGSVAAKYVELNPIEVARRANAGEYLDTHCWVFTPPSFLLTMAQIAKEGLLKFRCKQFYPTNEAALDRDNHSFVTILEKVDEGISRNEIRNSFLEALG